MGFCVRKANSLAACIHTPYCRRGRLVVASSHIITTVSIRNFNLLQKLVSLGRPFKVLGPTSSRRGYMFSIPYLHDLMQTMTPSSTCISEADMGWYDSRKLIALFAVLWLPCHPFIPFLLLPCLTRVFYMKSELVLQIPHCLSAYRNWICHNLPPLLQNRIIPLLQWISWSHCSHVHLSLGRWHALLLGPCHLYK